MHPPSRTVLLTVDLEDYRRQALRDHGVSSAPAHPAEVERQTWQLLELLERLKLRATFFCVGRLTRELPRALWQEISRRHTVGCHGYDHLDLRHLDFAHLLEDTVRGKAALEDCIGQEVSAYRAPYFSTDGCGSLLGAALEQTGFRFSSSLRLSALPLSHRGGMTLAGSTSVLEIPLRSVGWGPKRFTVIGGTWLRLLPLRQIQNCLETSADQGFIPMIYIHNYDADVDAAVLNGSLTSLAGDVVRRAGRSTVAHKLEALSRVYQLRPLEEALLARDVSKPGAQSIDLTSFRVPTQLRSRPRITR